MANLAFELGFDWNVPPIQGVRDGVFPLQMALVRDGTPGQVISPYDPSVVQVGSTLCFRVYDFTDAAHLPGVGSPSLEVLQVLFTSATTVEPPPGEPSRFSPVKDPDGNPVAQMFSTGFTAPSRSSIAFDVKTGWDVTMNLGSEVLFSQDGRFNFRALLTVAFPGQMARFYRADPEMVIGGE